MPSLSTYVFDVKNSDHIYKIYELLSKVDVKLLYQKINYVSGCTGVLLFEISSFKVRGH